MTPRPPFAPEAPDGLVIIAPEGMGEVTAGVDLARSIALMAATVDWPDGSRGLAAGDVVVVTSKVVAKAEGRVVPADEREAVIDAEAVGLIAELVTPGRPVTRIVRNRHGVVLAAAGIDASNTEPGTVVLWPSDPDAAAGQLRRGICDALQIGPVGVVVTDTLGRAWRIGQTDAAIGVSGLLPIRSFDTGDEVVRDRQGNELRVTAPAVADELAAAVDLVKGKTAGRPVAFVRGLAGIVTDDDGPGARALVRPVDEDLFARGSAEAYRDGLIAAVVNRRTVRQFTDADVPDHLIRSAVADAVTAPAPHHTAPWRFVQVIGEIRERLLDAMAARWRRDLEELDGFTAESIAKRVRRGDVLRDAPALVLPFVALAEAAHPYPDADRRAHERDLFVLSGGAGVQNFMLGVAARGAASAWVSASVFCPEVVRDVLALPTDWQPLGGIAVGYPAAPAKERQLRPADDHLHVIG